MPPDATVDKRVAHVTTQSLDGIGFAMARLLDRQGFEISIASTTKRIEDKARELAGGLLLQGGI